ncbi:sugar ABC transporter permease [Paenibacillus sp. LHD-38]|uniref:carbohydrate ABC transporter permease n=1 Tax=Paenibacillus sp. LHD-38 TaxID=3072143 RepID=UPI00280F943D|nr:sugar ABC transporter permease [Paenibacillus sp. LHD-38]MDQ8734780.1 sugar ABC transporter permease [Paenibacillus sp. LHD-38]
MQSLRKKGFIISFLLPAIVMFLLIYVYPLANIFFTSFSKWDYKNLNSPELLGWTHLFDNYIKLFTNDYFFNTALFNSLKWVALVLLIQIPFSLLVALVLSQKPRGWVLARNAFIIPNIISSAAIGLIFVNLYDPARGLVTEVIRKFNSDVNLNILADTSASFWGVTFAFILFGGVNSLLIMTQRFSISNDIYEAAKIDGANVLQSEIHITLPLLRPMIGTVAILATNYSLLLFNEIELMTKGGPDNSTYSLSYYIYQTAMGSTKLNFALANTAGVIQFILGILLVVFISRIFRANESY